MLTNSPGHANFPKMWFAFSVWLFLTALTTVSAIPPIPSFDGNPFERYSISAEGINATFMPYGARLTNLFVKDRTGVLRDVVMGYDTGEEYLFDTETSHSYMGAVVGRYANRIAFGTFNIGGNEYHIPENKGNSTLHGGCLGVFDKTSY